MYAYLCGRGHKYEGKPLYKAIVDFLRQKELLAQLFIGPSLATGPTVFFRTAFARFTDSDRSCGGPFKNRCRFL